MKRLLILLLCIVFVVSISAPASATTHSIVDMADLLNDDEKAALESQAQQIKQTYRIDVVIVTTEHLGGKTSEEYADDFYDNNGYGIGEDFSGILLLISMEARDWAISTCGEAIHAVTDYGIQDLFSQMAVYLSQDMFFQGFSAYLTGLESYLKAYRNGNPVDGYRNHYSGPGTYIPGTQDDIVHYEQARYLGWYIQRICISLVAGIVIAGIVLLVLRSQMNTAKSQHGASSYMLKDTYQINIQRDIFLYSQIRKVRKSETSSSGNRGGGSSVHSSGGGRSHGGGHGKF